MRIALVLLTGAFAIWVARDFKHAALAYVALGDLVPVSFGVDLGAGLPIITLSRLLLFSVLVVFGYRVLTGRVKRRGFPLQWPLLAFLVALLAANLLSEAPNGTGLFRLFSFGVEELTVYIIAVSVFETERDIRIFLTWLLTGLAATLSFALFEGVTRTNPIVEMAANAREGLVYDYTLEERFGVHRLQSFYRNPLDLAVFLELGIPFALMLAVTRGSWQKRWTGVILALGGSVVAALTLSRTPIYVFLVASATYVVVTRRWWIAGWALAISVAALWMVSAVFDFPLIDYLYVSAIAPEQVGTELGGSSLASLLTITGNHWDLFLQHPLFGRGISTLPPSPASAGLDVYKYGFGEQGWTYLLAEGGLMALVAFTWIQVAALLRIYRGWRTAPPGPGREFLLTSMCVVVGYLAGMELVGRWHFPLALCVIGAAIRQAELVEPAVLTAGFETEVGLEVLPLSTPT